MINVIILTIRGFLLGYGDGSCGGGGGGDEKCANVEVLTVVWKNVGRDRVLSLGDRYTMPKHVYFSPESFFSMALFFYFFPVNTLC